MKRKLFVPIFLVLAITNVSFAQQFGNINRMDDLFRFYDQGNNEAGRADVELLLEGYLTPLMKGVGFGMSNGWFNTAKTHKPGGFDLNITVSNAYIKDNELTFAAYPLQSGQVVGDSLIPSIAGPSSRPLFELNDGTQFEGIGGLNLENELGNAFVPTPMVTLGVGVIANTDVRLRFIPNIRSTNYGFRVNMMGLGVMHSLSQYMSGIDEDIDISFFGGYTRFNFEADLSPSVDTDNQYGLFNVDAKTVMMVASTDVSIFTFYAGVGVNHSTLRLRVTGEYDTDGEPSTIEVIDPLDMSFGKIGHKFMIGTTIKVALVTFNVDFTQQRYNTLTAGIGFTFK